MPCQALSIISKPWVNSNWKYSPETLNLGDNWKYYFVQCELEIWQMTLNNNGALFLYYIKLCAWYQSHGWIHVRVTVRKCSIWAKIDFLSHVTLKFDIRWYQRTIGHLFFAISSFLYHSTAIGEFKLELQSRNAQFGSKSMIFFSVWPWNVMDDLEKHKSTCSKQHQALCIISSPYVNSNWITKIINWVLTSATLNFDLWTCSFGWHHFCHWW